MLLVGDMRRIANQLRMYADAMDRLVQGEYVECQVAYPSITSERRIVNFAQLLLGFGW